MSTTDFNSGRALLHLPLFFLVAVFFEIVAGRKSEGNLAKILLSGLDFNCAVAC